MDKHGVTKKWYRKRNLGVLKGFQKCNFFFFPHGSFLLTTVEDISEKIKLLYIAFDPLLHFFDTLELQVLPHVLVFTEAFITQAWIKPMVFIQCEIVLLEENKIANNSNSRCHTDICMNITWEVVLWSNSNDQLKLGSLERH